MRSARPSGRGGFLLTETLATFTISAFVLLALVTISSILLRAVDRTLTHLQDADDLGRTLDAINRDVSSLSRLRFDGTAPQPFVFRGGPNSLFFAHRDIGRDGVPEIHVIALREIMVGDGTRIVQAVAKLSSRTSSFDSLRFGRANVLPTGSVRLRFSYLPPLRPDGIRPAIEKSWPIGRTLPAAVLVEAVDPATNDILITMRASIRANAEIGCVDTSTSEKGATTAVVVADPAGSPDPRIVQLTEGQTAQGGSEETCSQKAATSADAAR